MRVYPCALLDSVGSQKASLRGDIWVKPPRRCVSNCHLAEEQPVQRPRGGNLQWEGSWTTQAKQGEDRSWPQIMMGLGKPQRGLGFDTDRARSHLFSWAPKSLQMVTAAMNWKMLAPWKKSCDQPRQHIKKQRHYFADIGPYSQSYGFSSSHVWLW